jgi:hypothetical protein
VIITGEWKECGRKQSWLISSSIPAFVSEINKARNNNYYTQKFILRKEISFPSQEQFSFRFYVH